VIEDERVDEQQILVDEVVADQGLDEIAAAENADVLVGLRLELGDSVRNVAVEQGRVLPRQRFGQCVGGDVLRDAAEYIGEGVVLRLGPEVVEPLVGSACGTGT